MAPTPPTRWCGPALHRDGGKQTDSGAEDGVVLVADDDPGFTEMVELWLTPEWEVAVTHDGDALLAEYGPHVDAVLLDRRMPTVPGDGILSELRNREGDAGLALMTAVEPDWDAVSMAFDTYVRKPLDREAVRETVATLFERVSYAREVRALYSLSSELGHLDARYSETELETDRRYQRLQDEFERVNRQATERVDGADDGSFRELLQVVAETA